MSSDNMRAIPDGADSALRSTDLSHQGGEVLRSVQQQLSAPADIKAAHQWIQPTGGEAHLPGVAFGGATGGEGAAIHAAQAAMPIGHAAIMPVMPGAEHGAMA